MKTRHFLTPIAGLAALAALSGCGGNDVTKARLEGATQQEFVNLYLKQAAILGHTAVTEQTMAPQTKCDRGGPDGALRNSSAMLGESPHLERSRR